MVLPVKIIKKKTIIKDYTVSFHKHAILKPLKNKIDYFSGAPPFLCTTCGRTYKLPGSLKRHRKYECQKQPTFICKLCPYKAKHKDAFLKHTFCVHPEVDVRTFL